MMWPRERQFFYICETFHTVIFCKGIYQIITDFFVVISIQRHNAGYHMVFFINDAVLAVIAGQDQCIFHRSHIYEISITIALVIRMLCQWIVRIDMFLTGINHEFFWDDLFFRSGNPHAEADVQNEPIHQSSDTVR